MADPAFTLVPIDEIVEPEAALEAAVSSVLEDPYSATEEKDPPIPFGRSWAFDHDHGHFVRSNGSPAEVRGVAALEEYIQAALRTAAGRHAILPPNFGIQRPEDFLGSADPSEALSDFEARARTALTAHDRIEAVERFEAEVNLSLGIIVVTNLLIITDQEEAIPVGPFQIEPEG